MPAENPFDVVSLGVEEDDVFHHFEDEKLYALYTSVYQPSLSLKEKNFFQDKPVLKLCARKR